ncbi:hypothetical protein HHI36_012016 [Cryptolaemus montrouzieri]|uniref:Uncharacterized protein n=1 Tax=Cryptolaemus montrouzieri TaxID=559131 RepID=A0ABD2NDI7_9CUCU
MLFLPIAYTTTLLIAIVATEDSDDPTVYFKLSNKNGTLRMSSLPMSSDIQHIKIKGCRFDHIESNTFSKLPKLKKLEFEDNVIVQFPPRLFSSCSNLEILKFTHNIIEQGNPQIFADLPKVWRLDIKRTTIGNLYKNFFKGTLHLQYFECMSCTIHKIQQGTFDESRELSVINLANNAMRKFEFPALKNLEQINLSGNPLSEFNVTDIKQKCPNLWKIRLGGTRVSQEILNEFKNNNITVDS